MDSKNKYCIGDVVVLRNEVYRVFENSHEMSVRTSSFDGYTIIEIDNPDKYRFVGDGVDCVFYFAEIVECEIDGDIISYKCYNDVSKGYQWAYEQDIYVKTEYKTLKDATFNGDISSYFTINIDDIVAKYEPMTIMPKTTEKDSRKVLFEDDSCLLERRNNRYYFSLYNEETGEFIREISIYVKENGKVSIAQYA